MIRTTLSALAFTAFALTGVAHAEMQQFKATLNAATEVPPKTSSGTGEMTATFDTATKALTYNITYSGLTGPATMAHIHGPAAPGANAGVLVPFPAPVTSPIKGTVTLNDAQEKDLEDGMLYTNVHTAANPGGEIRGQIVAAK
jgi:hypothetical protein